MMVTIVAILQMDEVFKPLQSNPFTPNGNFETWGWGFNTESVAGSE